MSYHEAFAQSDSSSFPVQMQPRSEPSTVLAPVRYNQEPEETLENCLLPPKVPDLVRKHVFSEVEDHSRLVSVVFLVSQYAAGRPPI